MATVRQKKESLLKIDTNLIKIASHVNLKASWSFQSSLPSQSYWTVPFHRFGGDIWYWIDVNIEYWSIVQVFCEYLILKILVPSGAGFLALLFGLGPACLDIGQCTRRRCELFSWPMDKRKAILRSQTEYWIYVVFKYLHGPYRQLHSIGWLFYTRAAKLQ